MRKPTPILQRLIIAAVVALPLSSYAAADAPPPPPGAEQGAAGADKPELAPGMHGGPEDGPQHGAPGFGPGPGGREGGPGGPGGFGPGGPGGEGGPGPFGHGGMPPFLHGLALSEAQDDKLFAIVYAQEPQLREQHKIIRKSHEALRELKKSGKYDDAKAVTLVQAGAQAMAKIELLRLRGEQQILALLTPEQRQKISERGHGPDRKEGKEDRDQDGGRPAPRPQQK